MRPARGKRCQGGREAIRAESPQGDSAKAPRIGERREERETSESRLQEAQWELR